MTRLTPLHVDDKSDGRHWLKLRVLFPLRAEDKIEDESDDKKGDWENDDD